MVFSFFLFRTPEQCPSVVSLLSESYNPHVRYGAAMALGICCAGTGNKEAINLLEPMTNDPVNYVRQGALIASALIMIQQTEVLCPKVSEGSLNRGGVREGECVKEENWGRHVEGAFVLARPFVGSALVLMRS
ncbi:26S proteasome non-ATPase regulatory subunit 1-like [Pantherophis guttatus]|uniref:26S proteasome non-ATPase regulatory subunit 1-like n=1 Tax=Pantherophis guttatus TaxID=94885 RepID=A0ABM3YXQ9_PANGU|nr:26S proteasome non-ATPase regulatory subunit 1-like [Pantherophis guttatus]